MKDELAARVRIPYEYVKLKRELDKRTIPIRVSMDNPWKIDASILHASLFEAVSFFVVDLGLPVVFQGIVAPVDSINMAEKFAYSGPNFELEAASVEFTIVVSFYSEPYDRIFNLGQQGTQHTSHREDHSYVIMVNSCC